MIAPEPLSDGLAAYARDGYAVFRGVLDAGMVAEIRAHVAALQARYGEGAELFQLAFHNDDAFWLGLLSDDRLLDLVARFIGPNIALFNSNYFCKAPHVGQPVLWHQDGSYWHLDPMVAVSLWIAVDDSTHENGCMRVVPGSHRQSLAPLRPRPDVKSFLGSSMDPAAVNEAAAVNVVLQSGDVSVHHPNLIHGSRPNLSAARRCGLAARYIPPASRIMTEHPAFAPILDSEGRWPTAFLLRGCAAPNGNKYQPFPRPRLTAGG